MWLESHSRKAKQLSSPLNIISVCANKRFMDGGVYNNWPLVDNLMVCGPHSPSVVPGVGRSHIQDGLGVFVLK